MSAPRAVVAAFAYFSIFPAGRAPGAPDARALAALPLVGAIIGLCAGGAAWAAARAFPHGVAVAVAFTATVLLSGAIHLDGFLDSCDALFAPVEPVRRLEILKDPRHGTFAIAGFAVLLPVWLAALDALPVAALPWALAFAAASSRWGAAVVATRYAYARPVPHAALARRPPVAAVALGGAALFALSFAVASWAWTALAIALAVTLLAARFAAKRLGGALVGDVYGFAISLAEPSALLALVALAGRGR